MKHEHRVGILGWPRALREWASGGPSDADPEEWRRDPLLHPALRAMSMTQLADIPFDPRCISDDEEPAMGVNANTEPHEARQDMNSATPPDDYLLGRDRPEETRLQRQIANLAPDSEAQLDALGIKPGERVVDLGCGPGGVLHLLAERVGPAGSVLGIDRSLHFVKLARRFVAGRGLPQVEVREGNAYDTGLPRGDFDGAHMRLVLVNVPEPDRIVREMVSLVRPGGWVASFEADYLPHTCDPPLPAWDRLLDAYKAYSMAHGIDLFVGRRTHRMFREAGVEDIRVTPVIHVYPAGHDRRPILRDFISNVSAKLVEGGFIERAELERDMAELESHLSRPEVLVTSHIFYRLNGRRSSSCEVMNRCAVADTVS